MLRKYFIRVILLVIAFSKIKRSICIECTSPNCSETVDDFLEYLDEEVDPCNDFFDYACGKWNKTNPLPNPFTQWNNNLLNKNKTIFRIKNIFENVQPDDFESLRKAKTFYNACLEMNTMENRIECSSSLGSKGCWPITFLTSEWSSKGRTWSGIHNDIYKSSAIATLFTIEPEIDPENISANIITIKALNKFTHEKWNDIEVYKIILADDIQNITKNSTQSSTFMENFSRITILLKRLMAAFKQQGIIQSSKKTTIKEMQRTWDNAHGTIQIEHRVDWLYLISDLYLRAGIKITDDEPIIVQPATFIEKFASILTTTPQKTIVDYMMWEYVYEAHMSVQNEPTQVDPVDRLKIIDDINDSPWFHSFENQISSLTSGCSINLNILECLEMMESLKKTLKRRIWDSPVLNTISSKFEAMWKINNTVNNCGYSSWYENTTKIDDYYKELLVGTNNYENIINLRKFTMTKKLETLRQIDRDGLAWQQLPTENNAQYSRETKSIDVPLAMIDAAIFEGNYSDFLNYATLGMILAHELHHLFDRDGRIHDQNGNQASWTTQEWSHFIANDNCFIQQYMNLLSRRHSNFNMLDSLKKSDLKLNEFMADTDGLISSYQTFKNFQNSGKILNPIILPQNFTQDRLFFLAFARFGCGEEKPEFENSKLALFGSHPPSKIRINGAVMNSEGFSKAFKCPSSSPMNPSMKCSFWK